MGHPRKPVLRKASGVGNSALNRLLIESVPLNDVRSLLFQIGGSLSVSRKQGDRMAAVQQLSSNQTSNIAASAYQKK